MMSIFYIYRGIFVSVMWEIDEPVAEIRIYSYPNVWQ